MFQTMQRRPVCELGLAAARLHGRTGATRTHHRNTGDPSRTEGLGRGLGRGLALLLTCLQRAGVRAASRSGSGEGKKKPGLMSMLADHCGFVTGLRLRRAQQVGQLYSDLYSERARWSLVSSVWRRLQGQHVPAGRLVAALAGVFMWEHEKIEDEEIRRCGLELQELAAIKRISASPVKAGGVEAGELEDGELEAGWEAVVEKKDFKVWKRPLPDSHLYEYRVLASYDDVTPRQFFNVQLDTEYRKTWDSLVIKLEVVDRDANTGSEVVHWATHFPYPMYSRDYVYVRRYDVDWENNLMVLVSRAVAHPRVPETQQFVRVHSYQSKMVIRPHKSFDENGFDYLLTYSDDPQTAFPRYCVSWMVSSGMPDFLDKLHTAALRAKNLEVGIQDYTGVLKPKDRQPSQERHAGDNSRTTGGPGPIYA
ncbi:StAR-related lipid transfer protein 7, mitochondrial [Merluccius polli]|uniref:StAR-related lipid transfer protein 7, mitochondrial n=1 Tax=Merluccius polli TaxID=89951 RepID=A0AA47MX05_MERPO|nr:StAR-related lipid transfer protein 7, mitochondrial [Merluccius polli]